MTVDVVAFLELLAGHAAEADFEGPRAARAVGATAEEQERNDGNVGANRTRPLCDWPTWPAYAGGPASVASSFRCEM